MANIDGLFGYNKATGTNLLLAAYGNDLVNVDTGTGYSFNLTAGNKVEMDTFLDYLFAVNGTDITQAFDGTTITSSGQRVRCPVAKYVKTYGTKLYLGYLTVNSQTFHSRIWHSDLPQNNDVRWGIEWGTNLAQTASSAVVTSSGVYFDSYGIKAGDPLFVLDGANKGQYEVKSVDSNNQLTLTTSLSHTASSTSYIVGSNYFDVRTNDNDYLRGLGENSDRLLAFKLHSLHRYNGSSLFQVKGAPGTSSHRSIVNSSSGALTGWFHGSQPKKTGVYLYDGVDYVKASAAIQPYIDGIASTIFTSVVGWVEDDWMRWYVGDITNSQRNISVTKAVISYDATTNKWSIDPINKVPKCATVYEESDVQKIFLGDDSAEVFQTPSGFTFDGDPIPWAMETGPHYPQGASTLLRYTRAHVIARDAKGIRVRYRLIDKPSSVDETWHPLGELTEDKTELIFPSSHGRSSGVEIRLDESGIRENSQYIEKIILFYKVEMRGIK
jgi:hypothetical protein